MAKAIDRLRSGLGSAKLGRRGQGRGDVAQPVEEVDGRLPSSTSPGAGRMGWWVGRRGGKEGYDAFVSYSHAGDGELAPALQAGVERFAKPWYRARALKVFRDETSLSADPGLWSAIELALSRSSWFVLMASPDAAASPWVNREIRWWLEHRSVKRLLIVVTSGALHWDEGAGDFDWTRSTALPAALRGAFDEEPRWVNCPWLESSERVSRANPDLQQVVADLAAAIHGMAKDELVGVHVREHKRTRRLAGGAIAALVILLVSSIAAAVVAVAQRNTAVEQANLALSRQLAAVSGSQLSTNLDVAQLLAVRAYRTDPNPQTRSALMQAVTASPNLVRYLPMGGEVAELAGSGDRRTVVAGLDDGRVVRWDLAEPKPHTVLTLHAQIVSLAVSRDGAAVVASDGIDAMLWQRGRPAFQIKVPSGQRAGAVALSPSGRTAVVRGSGPVFGGAESIVIFDVPSRTARATREDPQDYDQGLATSSLLVAASDDELFLLDEGYGGWQRRRISDWALEAGSDAGFGAHNLAVGVSSDGGSLTQTNGQSTIPVWRTSGPTDPDHPAFTAEAPISSPDSLTLSPDGTAAAVADSGTIYVSPVARSGLRRPGPVQLVGNGSINADGVRFFGDGEHLLSASGDRIAVWDLGQLDRLARTSATPVHSGCSGCSGPVVAVAPDGRRVAVVDGSGESAVIQALDRGSARPLKIVAPSFDYAYGPPVWDLTGRRVVLPVSPPAGGSGVSAPSGLPPAFRAWPAGEGSDFVAAAGRGGDGRTLAIVNTHGQIRLQDTETGAVRRTLPGPPGLAGESGGLQLKTAAAAVGSASNLVAVVDDKGSVVVTDLDDGRVVETRLGSDAEYVAFAGRRLLVQRKGGSLEVWDQRGKTREQVPATGLRSRTPRGRWWPAGGPTGRSCWPTSTAVWCWPPSPPTAGRSRSSRGWRSPRTARS
jgi:hypothetical protein